MPLDDITPYLEGAALSALIEDWQQTSAIARNPDYYERNPALGKHPSQDKVNAYMSAAGLTQLGLYESVPKDYKLPIALTTLGLEGYWINSNVKRGLPKNYLADAALSGILGRVLSYHDKKNKLAVGVENIPDTQAYGPILKMKW